jgi:O-antigen/teichoic acid export membrane protein
LSIQKKIAKNAVYNFLIKAITLAFGFVASVVVARFLGPERYGVYSFVMWVLYAVGLLVNLGINTTITKYVSEYWGRSDFSTITSIFRKLFRFELVAGVVVTLLLFLFAPLIAHWYHNPDLSLYLKVSASVLLPMGLMWVFNGLFCGLQRYDLIAIINLIVSPLTVGIILLVLYLGGKIEWLVAVSAITNILLLISYIYLKRTRFDLLLSGGRRTCPERADARPSGRSRRTTDNGQKITPDLTSKLFKFSASVFVILILDAIVWERFGILFLSIFSASSEIAFYNVAFILSSRTMILLPGALTGILLPAMSEVYGRGNREELAKVHANATRYLAMLSLPLCLGGIAIARQLLPMLYGFSFQPASLLFMILLLGGTVGSISTSSSSLLYSAELQGVVVRVGILSALVNLTVSWLLVHTFGAKGVAIANALAQTTAGVIIIYYAYKKYMKQKFPYSNIVRIISSSVLMGIIAFVMAETLKGASGVICALIVSFPLYILSLLFTRSLTSEDINLLEAAIHRMPEAWGRTFQPMFGWLIRFFYSHK